MFGWMRKKKQEGAFAAPKGKGKASQALSFGFRAGVFTLLVYSMAAITLYVLPYLEAFVGQLLGIGADMGVADAILWLFSGMFVLAWVLWLEFWAARALKRWLFPRKAE